MATLTPSAKQQFFDANGNPLAGGKLYTYAAGTTTPLVTYTNSGGITANTNPIILDSRGEANIWLGSAAYKFKLTTSTDVELWTVDDVSADNYDVLQDLAASGGSALVGFIQSGSGAASRTVQAKLRDVVNVKDFGAVGDGVADDTAAIQAALDYCETNGYAIQGAPGTYKITSTLVIKCSGDMSAMTINADATTVTTAVRVGPAAAAQYLFNEEIILPFVNNTAKTVPGWTGFTNSIGVHISNVYQSRITVPYVYNFGVGVTVGGYSTGCAHNVVTLGVLWGNRIQLQVQPKDASGFVNENLFIGGRIEYSSSEGTAVAGTAYIQLRPYAGASNDPNNNVFLKQSVEGIEGEYQLSIAGAYNKFINPRLESATTIRIQFYAESGQTTQGNVIDGGYKTSAATVTNTGAGSFTGNFWVNNQKNGETRHYSGNGMNLGNATGGSNPHMQGFPPAVNPFNKDETATDWQYRVSSDSMLWKLTGDTYSRTILDSSGFLYFGRGGAAATDYLRAAGVAGAGIMAGAHLVPDATGTRTLGQAGGRWSATYTDAVRVASAEVLWTSGSGTPEGAVTAPVGSLYTRTNGGAGTTLYVKESGTGNTGWVAK